MPESPDGGSVFVQTDGAVTTAHYTCAKDYTLYGAEIRKCLADNTWELDMPACSKNYNWFRFHTLRWHFLASVVGSLIHEALGIKAGCHCSSPRSG